MNQQDSFGNMYARHQRNPSYMEVGQPIITTRSVEPSYPIKHLDFTTGNGKGHQFDWDEINLKFIARSCLRPTCKVCGVKQPRKIEQCESQPVT